MADNTVQNMTLTGGNEATNRYMNYYNQIKTQLVRNQNPATIQAQVIELPREMQAQQISAPERIQAERIATEDRTYGDYANEVASYLDPYLQNAIRDRRDKTSEYRAIADADAWSRGMGGSTFLSDQKNQLAKAEARDIMAARNEFLANVGQQAFSALQNQYNRNLQANMQNAANALSADTFNANMQNAVDTFNANALMNADQYNINNLLNVAMQNAANALAADQFNANARNEWTTLMEQIAQGWANQMYEMNPYVAPVTGGGGGGNGGGGGGNGGGGGGVELIDQVPKNVKNGIQSTMDLAKNTFLNLADKITTSLATNPLGVLTGNGAKSTAANAPASTANDRHRGGTYRDYYADNMRASTR